MNTDASHPNQSLLVIPFPPLYLRSPGLRNLAAIRVVAYLLKARIHRGGFRIVNTYPWEKKTCCLEFSICL